MSSITSYKTTAFKESQKFFVIDPSTQSPSFVLGSDLVSYITPMLNYVRADSTRLSAENTDYDVGTLVQTSGATSPGDNLASTYLVVEGGTGDFPMLNGNDLLVVAGDDDLRAQLISNAAGEGSDLVAYTGTAETITEATDRQQTEIDGRVIRVSSLSDLKALTAVADYQVSLSGLRSGIFRFDASNLSSEVTSDPQEGVYVAPDSDATGASGAWVRQYEGSVSLEWFGADGTYSNDTLALTSALDLASDIQLSDKDYFIDTAAISTLCSIKGVRESSGGGTRFVTNTDSPILDVSVNGVSISRIAFIGDNDNLKTAQAGIKVTDLNNVLISDCFFSDLHDSIYLDGECFYINIDECFFQDNIRSHVYAVGNTGPGNDIRITNCRVVPNSGQYGFFFDGYGSIVMDSVTMSPNNLSQNSVLMQNPGASAGVQQISNSVFEGSAGASFRVIGAGSGASRAKFFFFSNCYFGNSGPAPSVDLTNVRSVQFNGGYVTNGSGQALIFLTGDCRDVSITGLEFQGTGEGVLADTGSLIDGLFVTSPSFGGSVKFINLDGAASRNRVSVVGGRIGTNATPVSPPGLAGMIVDVPEDTKYSNEGVATFNGGVSLFTITTGLVRAPTRISVLPNSVDAGNAEIREITLTGNDINVQCKSAAAAGTGNVRFFWSAE